MKKIILTTSACIFFLLQANAQINLGIKAALNLSNVKFPGSPNNSTRLGFNAGLLTQVSIFKKFIIQPELLYSVKGHKFPATNFDGGGTLSLNYISVPVLVGFRPTKKLSVLAGPEFNFLTSANSKFDGKDHDVSKIYRKFDMAVDISVAYKIIAGLGAELRYSYGFDDLVDAIITDQNGNDIGKDRVGSNRVFQCGFFYKFSRK
jgi:Outer membrane protein beta-barrel domain